RRSTMRQARFSSLLIRSLLALLVGMPVIALVLALQTRPRVASPAPLDQADLARVERLLLDATPRSPSAAGQHEVAFSPEELNLLLNYGLELLELTPEWTGAVALADDQLRGQLSIEFLGQYVPTYLNVETVLEVSDNGLQLTRVTLGDLPIPPPLLQFTLDRLQANLLATGNGIGDIQAILANIDRVHINPDHVEVSLLWDPALVERLGQQAQMLLISGEDEERIVSYYEEISLIATAVPADLGAVSLNTFLVPLFQSALSRSLAGSDPVAENRTLLQTLAIYVNDEDIARLLSPERAAELTPAKFIEVRLQRRQDLAQHLVSIAAISASAGAGFAELLSNTKEAYDARYRSGFSFSDLTANTVGVLIADYATGDAQSARLLQERMGALSDESDYMPQVGNNRDGISESDFSAIYVDRNSPEYLDRLAEIEALIAARPLFQGMPAPGF
ncbi:MAG: hypothetical protein WD396_10160, partial [Pseudohongiellaceae bacterium]